MVSPERINRRPHSPTWSSRGQPWWPTPPPERSPDWAAGPTAGGAQRPALNRPAVRRAGPIVRAAVAPSQRQPDPGV